jgi:acetyl/propionyl-CoA carboxylase alpha subunit
MKQYVSANHRAVIPTSISLISWRPVEITNADAVHPGYGFLAENSRFAQICNEHDIKFIGPTAEMINSMGDKITA